MRRKKAYKSLRHELLESKMSGSTRSKKNAEGPLGLGSFSSCKSGRSSAEAWPEEGGEKGGERDGDGEKKYL
ncbi:LOW QUALITY PROTEIN: hypothetical protein TorRG33x02_205620 [Trema orientale]|uniref:Uncharacterized protein n=1 Tax=Trema orientale TaxID=63057 RepID=A0A2P5EDJ1_TREOI|nr:LOW QUALITY PROTEIN: hypothetical protein TorRG33x02_205620 [Trema orientale]